VNRPKDVLLYSVDVALPNGSPLEGGITQFAVSRRFVSLRTMAISIPRLAIGYQSWSSATMVSGAQDDLIPDLASQILAGLQALR
jgi:hypothetical protein